MYHDFKKFNKVNFEEINIQKLKLLINFKTFKIIKNFNY